MKIIPKILLFLAFLAEIHVCKAQDPIVPGYFADPNIKEFEGKYYLYSTTDGYGSIDGEPLVWTSPDLENWTPQSLGMNQYRYFWAPSVIAGKNGKYYLYYTNGMDYSAYVWEGESPLGPWKDLGQIGGFDFEIFQDPVSGNVYGISASKEIYEFDNDPTSSGYLLKIIKKHAIAGDFFDFTEGPYILYKEGYYYLMWAGGRCWQESYNVRYAYSKSIFGPYKEGENNPILETNYEKEIYGPGHHSILKYKNKYLIFYHRMDKNRFPTCNYRHTCVGALTFGAPGKIEKVQPLEKAGDFIDLPKKTDKTQFVNFALNIPVTTDSEIKDYNIAFINDGKNDTRWMSEGGENKMVMFDLGERKEINRIEVYFEYLDKYNLYKIEYSTDLKDWKTYADYTQTAQKGYETFRTIKTAKARYIRMNVLRTEDKYASIWEVKILGEQ